MTRHPDRARETRVRSMARRQELVLVKSRRRDPAALDYGRYHLLSWDEDSSEFVIVPGIGDPSLVYGATLDEIERWLRSGAWSRQRADRAGAEHAGAGRRVAGV